MLTFLRQAIAQLFVLLVGLSLLVCADSESEELGLKHKPLVLHDASELNSKEEIQGWLNDSLSQRFGLGLDNRLVFSNDIKKLGTMSIIAVHQTFLDRPVIGGESRILMDADNQPKIVLGQHTDVHIKESSQNRLSIEQATAMVQISKNGSVTKQIVYWPDAQGEFRLALEIEGDLIDTEGHFSAERVYIDMTSGEVLQRLTLAHSSMDRNVYDFKAACEAMGIDHLLITPMFEQVERRAITNHNRNETSAASSDATVEEGFALLGDGYLFIEDILGMLSIDDNDLPLQMFVNVHFQEKMPTIQCYGKAFNAVWMSHKQSLYLPHEAMPLVEIMMHELAHGIVSNGSNLIYEFQSGALNESIADSIGVAFRIWRDHADKKAVVEKIPNNYWQLRLPDKIARDMSDPQSLNFGNLRYPDHMEHFLDWPKSEDHGGVHFNSSIINLAFYLLSEGGTHPRRKSSTKVRGIGVYKSARIFAQAAAKLLMQRSNFEDARYAFAQAAESLYGEASQEWISVHRAMDAVGVSGQWSEPEIKSEPETPKEEKPSTQQEQEEKADEGDIPAKWIVVIVLGGLGLIVAITALITMKPKSDDNVMFGKRFSPQTSAPIQTNVTTAPHITVTRQETVIAGSGNVENLVAPIYSNTHLWLKSLDGVQKIPLNQTLMESHEGLIVGRTKEVVHIHLEDQKVSRRHMRFRYENGKMTAEDLNSTLGSMVDGERLKPFVAVALTFGQLIRIAEFSFTLTDK